MAIRIHIGVHKTATTELQWALVAARKRLLRGNMVFLGPESLRGQAISLHMALRGIDAEVSRRVTAQLSQAMEGDRNLLISEENIIGTTTRSGVIGQCGQLYPLAEKQLGRMLALLGGRPVEMFMAVRDPADFVTSTYGQQLRRPAPLHQDIYLRDFRLETMSWASLARRLLSQGQVTRLICWRYEDYAALRPSILSRMVGPRAAARIPPPRRVNSGISLQAYQAFVEAALADSEAPTQQLLADACRRYPKRAGVPAMRILSDGIHAESQRRYAEDIAELAALDRVQLLRPEDAPSDA